MNPESEQPLGATEQEQSDIDVRAIFKLLAAIVVGLIVVSLLAYGQYRYFHSRAEATAPPASPFAGRRQAPPGPLLEVNEAESAAGLRREQEQRISEWRWLDSERTMATIPIERAMALIAENGLPRFAAPDAGESNPPRGNQRPERLRGAGHVRDQQ